jgi:hypothetical protein
MLKYVLDGFGVLTFNMLVTLRSHNSFVSSRDQLPSPFTLLRPFFERMKKIQNFASLPYYYLVSFHADGGPDEAASSADNVTRVNLSCCEKEQSNNLSRFCCKTIIVSAP